MTLRDELAKAWKDEKMIVHCLKNSKYIEIDGHFVDVGDAKPHIDKTLWYDDEKPDPGKSLARFIAYNMRNAQDFLRDNNKHYFGTQYTGQAADCMLWGIHSAHKWDDKPPQYAVREITPAELRIINKAIAEIRDDFKDRLEKYYKRYFGGGWREAVNLIQI